MDHLPLQVFTTPKQTPDASPNSPRDDKDPSKRLKCTCASTHHYRRCTDLLYHFTQWFMRSLQKSSVYTHRVSILKVLTNSDQSALIHNLSLAYFLVKLQSAANFTRSSTSLHRRSPVATSKTFFWCAVRCARRLPLLQHSRDT